MIATIAALRNLSGYADGAMEFVNANNSIYQYVATSETADDGLDVIRPVMTGAGRWIRIKILLQPDYTVRKSIAKPITATLSAAETLAGVITSTSAAAVTLTLPTATSIAGIIPGVGVGTTFDLFIDNSAGANPVTIAVGTGITKTTPAITGGDSLAVAVANKVGLFRFYFTSGTTANIFRIF